jgi:hypothetical protein
MISKETNRLITGVDTTFYEVTVDSAPFKSKNELGTAWAMLRQRYCVGDAPSAMPALGQRQHSARCDDSAPPNRR